MATDDNAAWGSPLLEELGGAVPGPASPACSKREALVSPGPRRRASVSAVTEDVLSGKPPNYAVRGAQ